MKEFIQLLGEECVVNNDEIAIVQFLIDAEGQFEIFSYVRPELICIKEYGWYDCIESKVNDPNLNFGRLISNRTARGYPTRVHYTVPIR